MNFFKKILGYEKDLSERIKEFKTRGTLFEVIQTTRNIKYLSLYADCRCPPLLFWKMATTILSSSEAKKRKSTSFPFIWTWMWLRLPSTRPESNLPASSGNCSRRHSTLDAICNLKRRRTSRRSCVWYSRRCQRMSISRTILSSASNWREFRSTSQK